MSNLPILNKKLKTELINDQRWADLHHDILLLIKKRLFFIDQLRFGAVCRNWHSVPRIRCVDKFPWIVGFRWASYTSLQVENLYDPSNGEEYSLEYELHPGVRMLKSHFKICASMRGWVFLAGNMLSGEWNLFLDHAFTMNTKALPVLEIHDFNVAKGAFSTFPYRSNCVFYVVSLEPYSPCYRIALSTYREGDVNWKTLKLKCGASCTFQDAILFKGLFYCVFDKGSIWSFDVSCGTWQQLEIDITQIEDNRVIMPDIYSGKLVETGGLILLVYYSTKWKPWYIFRLDLSLMKWVKLHSLGNRALFLGQSSFCISTDGGLKSLAGHIFYHGARRSFYYPFKNSGQHSSSAFYPLKSKLYDLLTTNNIDKVWVQP